MLKKFYEFRSIPDTEIEEPITKPRTKPLPPGPNPYEEPDEDEEDDEDYPLRIEPDVEPMPKLKQEKIIFNKLKEVLNEKGMSLEDLYKMCKKI